MKYRIVYEMALVAEVEAESEEQAKKTVQDFDIREAFDNPNIHMTGEPHKIRLVCNPQ